MLTHRVADAVVSPLSPGVVPFSATLRAVLELWQAESDPMPEPARLRSGAWRIWLEHCVQYTVLRSGRSEPHGFRAAPFGVVLRHEIEIDLGPRLVSVESPASFWLNQTVSAEKPLLAYGALEPIGVAERRGEMLFLPLGKNGAVGTILAAVAPTQVKHAAPSAATHRGASRISA